MAGRLLALAYLFCVLAPAMSFAFADGARAAPCLIENEHGMGIVHEHGIVAQHVHEDGRTHDHSSPARASVPEDVERAIADAFAAFPPSTSWAVRSSATIAAS